MNLRILKKKTVFEEANPFDVSDFVRQHIGQHDLRIDRETGSANLRYATLGHLGVGVISYGSRACVENIVGIEYYHFQLALRGQCQIKSDQGEFLITPGWGALVNPRAPTSIVYSGDCEKIIIKIPEKIVNLNSIDCFGVTPEAGVRFDSKAFRLDIDSDILRAVDLICLEAEEYGQHKNSHGKLESYFISKILEFAPSNVRRACSNSTSDPFFKKIDYYIENNITDCISADDLAMHCNISMRTLYDRFSKSKGINPSSYAKLKKLRRIYSHLSSRYGKEFNITEIALEYGFNHLGRFSAEYKSLFGELPSETLRRRRSSGAC